MTRDPLYYLHIQKCAGSSLTSILKNHFKASAIFKGQFWHEFLALSEQEIGSLELVCGHLDRGALKYLPTNTKTISFLRNPIERYLSDYSFAREKKDLRSENLKITKEAQDRSLEEYILDESLTGYTHNVQTRSLGCEMHSPEALLIDNKELLKRAKEFSKDILFVGITERFRESIDVLSYLLNWYPELYIPSRNITKKRYLLDNLSKEAQDRIKVLNEQDLELYEYGNELLTENRNRMLSGLIDKFSTTPEAKNLNRFLNSKSSGYKSIESDVLALLKKRTHDSTKATNPTKQNIELRNPLICTNFYDREFTNDPYCDCYRWTGPGKRSSIVLPIKHAGKIKISIRIRSFFSDNELENCEFSINDKALIPDKQHKHPHPGQAVVSFKPFNITKREKECFLEFSILTATTQSPFELDSKSKDRRKLGISIDWLNVELI